ncbi:MAG: hypothetical protein V4597_11515 [Pseudomonadota bacterium]
MTDDELASCEQQLNQSGWLHGSLARPLINEVRRLQHRLDDLHNGREPIIPDMPPGYQPTPLTDAERAAICHDGAADLLAGAEEAGRKAAERLTSKEP